MDNKRKIIIAVCVVIALVLCIFGLTRCSGSANVNVTTETTESTGSASESETSAEPEATAEPSPSPDASAQENTENEPEATSEPAAQYEPEVNEDGSDAVTHILLIGADNDNTAGIEKLGNADGIVLVSINRADKSVSLTGILGGTMLDVADHPGVRDQATLIYHKAGAETLVGSVEKTLGITIDSYLCFNYLNVIDLIDQAGGMDVDVTPAEIVVANRLLKNLNQDLLGCEANDGLYAENVGTVHMTGKQAVCFMRVSIEENRNDFGRNERLRNMILQLKDGFLDLDASAQSDFIKEAIGSIQTNMSLTDALEYLDRLDDYSTYEIRTGAIPQDDTYYSNESYIHINIAQNLIWLFGQVYGENGGMPEALQAKLDTMQSELNAGRYVQYNY